MTGKTLYDKLWEMHLVDIDDDGNGLIYIDRHIIHEITSPQAFDGLRQYQRDVWRVDSILATPDHQVPTQDRHLGLNGFSDAIAKQQVQTLDSNCKSHGINQFALADKRQGIVHVVGPEQGATLPGMTVVCGDSHSSTHGAFAALAQGVGTSEVEHVLATQTLMQKKCKNMRVNVNGKLAFGVTAKDMILYIIGQLGSAGGSGYAIEYAGSAVQDLSMEGRLTLCNMTIEAGARSGMVAFDDVTANYLKDKPFAPQGEQWQQALRFWQTLQSDDNAKFDQELDIDASDIVPQVTWGTKPDQVIAVNAPIPDAGEGKDAVQQHEWQTAQHYMGVTSGQSLEQLAIDQVFIGSCTNGRIEDIRQVAKVLKGRKIASSITRAMVVPGSGLVKEQAEREGLDQIIIASGFEWRFAGCSMCNAMNPDKLEPGERCASTSNRNFEGRQGQGGRTHLVSPAMAAAAAIYGHFVDVRNISLADQQNSTTKQEVIA
ncbi:3-isopropylmalate dehydratase large subunit [Thalassotalea sp. HSM 43]|uniref:3-isopropylmalate dehydratase large subunit n=1 Tax=Thalassotalea sp. HSM 43 TaxID=2552945 RepID=UPI001080BD59|nr:3-isopropylmalate dehydratase large subunit [Thalassotalea sp. HSM 43]QBY04528.1 3-isopropylmalate dehydratase large subunit [Thalassotalea sp. HSM 43]